MRATLTALMLLATPVAAQTDADLEAKLNWSLGECIRSCTDTNSYGFCAETCGCMAAQMARHWDAEDFEARAARLQENPEDPAVSAEMSRLAQYCAGRIR